MFTEHPAARRTLRSAALAIAVVATFALSGCSSTAGGDAMASYLKGQWHCEYSGRNASVDASFGDGTGTYSPSGGYGGNLTFSTSGNSLIIQNTTRGESFSLNSLEGVPVGQSASFKFTWGGQVQNWSVQIDSDSKFTATRTGGSNLKMTCAKA